MRQSEEGGWRKRGKTTERTKDMLYITDDKVLNRLTQRITTPDQLNKVMGSLDPMSKDGPLLLQSLSLSGKQAIVKQYEKLFREEDE